MILVSLFWDVGAKGARPGGGHEGVPVRVYPEVVPVDPGQPRRQVAGVPVDAARCPQLASEALLDVLDRLEVAEQDLPQQRDVGDGETERVDLAESLLIRKCRDVSPQLLEGGVDAGAAEGNTKSECSVSPPACHSLAGPPVVLPGD